jgi:hypothetical protein
LRNGWQTGEESDDLQTFYDTIIRKLTQKLIDKAGGRITTMTIETKNGPRDVLGFEMTPEVRETLKDSMPLYSPRWPGQIPPPVATPNSPRQDARIMTTRG